jgi:hypothetical protein
MAVYDARPSAFTQLSTTGEWEYIHSAMGVRDGIDSSVGNAFNPSLDTGGRNAVMADGNAVIKGQLWRCDAPVNTPIPAASAQNRIDRLVLRLTRTATTSPTVVQPVVITGTPSGTPVEPPLVQTTTGIWDLPISSWTSTSAGGLTGLVDERQYSIDIWHDLPAGTNGWGLGTGGWKKYRLLPSGSLELSISLRLIGTKTDATIMFAAGSLTPAYCPSVGRYIPVSMNLAGATFWQANFTPFLLIGANGSIACYGVNATGLSQLDCHGVLPLI